MEKLRIKTFGWQSGILGQIGMINDGLTNIGCELVEENPDIVYKNEDFFDEALDFIKTCKNRPFVIFNVLDLQLHNPNYNLEKLKSQLIQADKVTCISDTVKEEIKQYLDIDAINISNPMRDITYDPTIKKEIDFAIIGRNSDPNKRAHLFEGLLWKSSGKSYIVVGSEPLPGAFFKSGWVGVLKDKELNEIYNLSKFVICCSKREGLLLTVPEACCGGAIPLIASDMSTCKEWNMPDFVVEPNVESILNKVLEIEKDYTKYQSLARYYGIDFQRKFNKEQIARNILWAYVNK